MPQDKADILADYREWRSQQEDRIGTHSDDCHMLPRHERCMIHRLAVEVERLRHSSVAEKQRHTNWKKLAVSVQPLD